MAVFVGGFDADAARAVAPACRSTCWPGWWTSRWSRWFPPATSNPIPPPGHMQAYAAEQLASANEVAAARARHLRYFSTIGIPAEYGFMSAGVVSLLEQWAADYGNVRAALEWAAAEPCAGLRMLAETKDLFFILGQADGSRLAEMILERCPERNRHRAEVMIAAGHFAFQLGEVTAASDLLMDAAEMGVEMGERAAKYGAFVPRAAGNARRRAR